MSNGKLIIVMGLVSMILALCGYLVPAAIAFVTMVAIIGINTGREDEG